jgi:hypothetical protein
MNEEPPFSDSPGDAEAANPYRSPQIRYQNLPQAREQTLLELEIDDGAALRAFRAAVIGLLICPPLLNFYSAWLLLRIALDERPQSARGERLCRWALLVDVAVCGLVGASMHFFW